MDKRSVSLICVVTLMSCLATVKGFNMTDYNTFKFCIDNSTCNAATECCTYIEYERNGAPLQTSPKCIPISRFEELWHDFTKSNNNIENAIIGCKIDTDEGLAIDEEATFYPVPEESHGLSRIILNMTLLMLAAISCFMV